MKGYALIGSRRGGGNTATLVREAVRGLEMHGIDTTVHCVGDMDIRGCDGCEGCRKDGICVIDDDMTKVLEQMDEADVVIFGSPTYFYNVTSDMKAVIDRMYCRVRFHEDDRSIWSSHYEDLPLRYAITISVCEQHDIADMGFTTMAMTMPLQCLGYRIVESVETIGLFEADAAESDEESRSKAKKAGEKAALLLKMKT